MNNKLEFGSIYDDFFKETLEESYFQKEEQNHFCLLDKIEELYLDRESKILFQKIIQFMEKFSNGSEKKHIPFNISIQINHKKAQSDLISILKEANHQYHYISGQEVSYLSFYQINKIEDLENYYKSATGIVVIEDLQAFHMYEEDFKKKLLHLLKEKLSDQVITIIVGKNKELKLFFDYDLELSNYFVFSLIGEKPSIHDVYLEVLKSLEETILEEDFKIKLLDYISVSYPKMETDPSVYIDQLIQYISFYKNIPELENMKSIEEIFKELNELVGLRKVKDTLNELVDFITLKEKTSKDLTFHDINLHMVFLGNPGTGKTTVARMICHILYDLKYIKQNKLVEVSSKDLVGEFVGQTAPKTMRIIEKAMGGILFIDEAYALKDDGKNNSYNGEAIATLIKAMEDYRDNLVVIFAGYTKEMQEFLNSNSGIVSRIGYTLEFEDYTNEELKQIFKNMMDKSGFVVEDSLFPTLEELIEKNRNEKNFGNARFIRNIYEKTILKHATNTKSTKNKKELKTITKEDLYI